MFAPLALSLWLSAAAANPAGQTLWLVEPLYPGQDPMVSRTEEALGRLLPEEDRASAVIGKAALSKALQAVHPDVTCLTGESTCADPLNAMVASLGFTRVVLLKGGNEAAGYRFKVSTFQPPESGKQGVASAESSGPTLERALLSALVKVVPLGAAITVTSEPPGAQVFIDNEKVGVTPLDTQILPGDRVVKLDLPLHLPVEEHLNVPAKGKLTFARTLERVPARITLIAHPDGAVISVDGRAVGPNKIDQGIQPGPHTFGVTLDGFEPYTVREEIAPGQTYTFEKTLKATGWHTFSVALEKQQENIYNRRSYFQLSVELPNITSRALGSTSFQDPKPALSFVHPGPNKLPLGFPKAGEETVGVSGEYGTQGRYFGLLVVGGMYSRSNVPWTFDVASPVPDGKPASFSGKLDAFELRALQPEARIALWKFELSLRAGLDLFGVHAAESASPANYEGGFYSLTLQVAAQLAVRFYIVEGLFLEGAYRYQYGFVHIIGNDSLTTRTSRLGLGYAF